MDRREPLSISLEEQRFRSFRYRGSQLNVRWHSSRLPSIPTCTPGQAKWQAENRRMIGQAPRLSGSLRRWRPPDALAQQQSEWTDEPQGVLGTHRSVSPPRPRTTLVDGPRVSGDRHGTVRGQGRAVTLIVRSGSVATSGAKRRRAAAALAAWGPRGWSVRVDDELATGRALSVIGVRPAAGSGSGEDGAERRPQTGPARRRRALIP